MIGEIGKATNCQLFTANCQLSSISGLRPQKIRLWVSYKSKSYCQLPTASCQLIGLIVQKALITSLRRVTDKKTYFLPITWIIFFATPFAEAGF